MSDTDTFDDDELLMESIRRLPILESLRTGPKSICELDDALSMSRSTVHRATQMLAEAGVVRKSDGAISLTGFGEVVAAETDRYRASIETARSLDEVLNVVSGTGIEVPLEHFEDADVQRPRPRQAHFGVNRITRLIEESSSLRMFSSIISPVYVDAAYREMMNGTDIEVIFDAPLVDIILEEYVDRAVEALTTGRFTVFVAEAVPFELFIYDDKMAMAAHNASALPQMFVECDDPGAIEWAESVYDRYRERAWRLDPDQISTDLEETFTH